MRNSEEEAERVKIGISEFRGRGPISPRSSPRTSSWTRRVANLVLLGLGLRRLGPLPQQVPQLLVVDLEHARLHLEGPPLLLQPLAALKDLPHGARDHARLVRGAEHRVRLAAASLVKGRGSGGGQCDESLRLI